MENSLYQVNQDNQRWKDEYDIIRFVERERQRKHPDLQLREEMLDYLNMGNEWMLI
jgi:hypothetical protein